MTNFSIQMNYLVLSHSLRLPLAQILGSVEILETSSLTEAQKIRVDNIRKAGVDLLQLIDHILSKCSKTNIDLSNERGINNGSFISRR